jgi:carboxymethylenebutenolidase
MCHPNSDGSPLSGGAGIRERRGGIDSLGARVPLFEAAPLGEARGNVIIIHDIHGANAFYHDLARRLAAAGYRAFLPDLFVREGPLPEQTSEATRARGAKLPHRQALADLTRVVDAAESRGGKTAVIGFCMGGTLVSLLSTREPRLAGGVIYYGFPANANKTELRPFAPIDEAADARWPLLGFWGDQDHGVGMDNVAAYDAALTAADKQHAFTIYPGLPHAFLTFDPNGPNTAGSADSWEKALAFFAERLS